MLTLAIEISNPGSALAPDTGQSVAIGRLGLAQADQSAMTLLAREDVAAPSRHDDDLQPAIQRAALAAGVSPRSIEAIAVSIGPGGFTALRVAIAAAKMIALASHAPGGARCTGVPTALAIAMGYHLRTPTAGDTGPIGVALAGKGDAAFLTVVPPSALTPRAGTPVSPPEGHICRAADLAGLGIRTLLADAHLPLPLREAATALGISVIAPRLDAVAVLHAAALMAPTDRALLAPLYGREPEAVTLWRERKAAGLIR